ncbi:MFS transporter [Sphingobacterium sp. LRF_L2]|uniref:MFS transporter n=1 Tax=Sphingobacterium sp. LRF_L2 TaxID=3369421 RepID=UPI003F647AEB
MINKGLVSLSFGAFALGMTEFTMMGILPDVASDLQISIPAAGHLIALYALGVVVGAPLLVISTAKYPPKLVLLFLMATFVIANVLFAFAPDNFTLMLSRFVAGLPHGAFFGVGGVAATRLVGEGKKAQALAIVFTGMTVANLAGVPLGTYISQLSSWRYTYFAIGLCGLITMTAIYFWLPKLAHNTSGSVLQQLAYFKTKVAWIIFFTVAVGTGGLFCWLSYIAPLMTSVAHIDESKVPLIMVCVGLGMVIGNLVGGKLADTIGAERAILISFGSMAVCLVFVYFFSNIPGLSYILSLLTGAVAFSSSPSLQILLINSAKGAETIAAAGGQAAFNLGNTLGAFLGGIPITYGFSFNSPSAVGILMSIGGMLFVSLYIRIKKIDKLASN